MINGMPFHTLGRARVVMKVSFDFAKVPAGNPAKPNENRLSPLYFAVDNPIGLPTRFVIEPNPFYP
jgi:hypothetical protein